MCCGQRTCVSSAKFVGQIIISTFFMDKNWALYTWSKSRVHIQDVFSCTSAQYAELNVYWHQRLNTRLLLTISKRFKHQCTVRHFYTFMQSSPAQNCVLLSSVFSSKYHCNSKWTVINVKQWRFMSHIQHAKMYCHKEFKMNLAIVVFSAFHPHIPETENGQFAIQNRESSFDKFSMIQYNIWNKLSLHCISDTMASTWGMLFC